MNKTVLQSIKTLSNSKASEVLNVISMNTIEDELKKIEGGCPTYECCPCDTKNPGTSDSCTCEGKCCTCDDKGVLKTESSAIDVNIAQIYEHLKLTKGKDANLLVEEIKKVLRVSK